MAGLWFGRPMSLLCGVMLATTYELYDYATFAEDDIYLAAIVVGAMAAFVKTQRSERVYRSFFSCRSWPILVMFALLGLTNFAKGPLVGAEPVVAAIGVYMLWNGDWAAPRLPASLTSTIAHVSLILGQRSRMLRPI